MENIIDENLLIEKIVKSHNTKVVDFYGNSILIGYENFNVLITEECKRKSIIFSRGNYIKKIRLEVFPKQGKRIHDSYFSETEREYKSLEGVLNFYRDGVKNSLIRDTIKELEEI